LNKTSKPHKIGEPTAYQIIIFVRNLFLLERQKKISGGRYLIIDHNMESDQEVKPHQVACLAAPLGESFPWRPHQEKSGCYMNGERNLEVVLRKHMLGVLDMFDQDTYRELMNSLVHPPAYSDPKLPLAQEELEQEQQLWWHSYSQGTLNQLEDSAKLWEQCGGQELVL
jgi:hypothetical protein